MRTFDISYSQLAVFHAGLTQPFNDWTKDHVAQGFTWRPGSVSFGTLLESGPMEVEIVVAAPSLGDSAASRILAVPLTVGEGQAVEVASITEGEQLSLPPGDYRLTFEHGLRAGDRMWAKLNFERVDATVNAVIVRADEGLTPKEPLVMEAEPAQ